MADCELRGWQLWSNVADVLNKEHKTQILNKAIVYMKKHPGKTVLEIVVKSLKISGFRPFHAPQSKIIKELLALFERNSSMERFFAVIHTWVMSEPDLKQKVVEYLSFQQEMEELKKYVENEDKEAIESTINNFASMMNIIDYEQQDVKLMICYVITECIDEIEKNERDKIAREEIGDLFGDTPADVNSEPIITTDSSIWEQQLQAIRAIPADAEDWDMVEHFIEQIRHIREEKKREREREREQSVLQTKMRDAFFAMLSSLKADYKDELEYFDANLIMTGQVQTFEQPILCEVAADMSALSKLFDSRRMIKQKAIVKASEEKKQRIELDLIDQQITDLLTKLEINFDSSSLPEQEADSCEISESVSESLIIDQSDKVSIESVYENNNDSNQLPDDDQENVADCLHSEISCGDSISYEETTFDRGGSFDLQATASEEDDEASFGMTTTAEEVVEPVPIVLTTEEVLPPVPSKERLFQAQDVGFWQLLAEDDLAGAYWYLRSLQAQGYQNIIPPELIATLYGSRIVNQQKQQIVTDMLGISRQFVFDRSSPEQQILALAAALRSSLVAPDSGLLAWLQTPPDCSCVHEIVQSITAFANRTPGLRQEDLLGFANNEQRQSIIRDLAADAKMWLEQARQKKLKIKRASDIWFELVNHKGQISLMLDPVAADRRHAVDEVAKLVRLFKDEAWAEARINELDFKALDKKKEPIIGKAKEQLLRYIKEAGFKAEAWCNVVQREREYNRSGHDWITEQMTELRNTLRLLLPKLLPQLGHLADSTNYSKRASLLCLLRNICHCADMLGISSYAYEIKPFTIVEHQEAGLYDLLRQRLFCIYEIEFDDRGEPHESQLQSLCQLLRETKDRDAKEALKGWDEKRDYRFVRDVLDRQSHPNQEELEQYWQEGIESCRTLLNNELIVTENKIEQAMVDGIIDDERAELIAVLDEIRCNESLNFHVNLIKMNKIQKELEDAQDKRIMVLNTEWIKYQAQMKNTQLLDKKQQHVMQAVNEALSRKDTRAVQECFDQLTEMFESGKEFDDSAFHVLEDSRNEILYEFTGQVEQITNMLSDGSLQRLIESIKQEKQWGPLNFSRRLSRTYLDSTRKGLEAWRWLKEAREHGNQNEVYLQNVLSSVGFNILAGDTSPISVISREDHKMHALVRMRTGGHSPVPQFGTYQKDYFDVICLWERPSADSIGGWLKDLRLENHNVLVLYLGRLRLRARCHIKQVSRERGLALAVLDENLLAFLADKDNRLAQFFRCALPFASINPYTPFQAGDVPPEMFFGRRQMAKDLQMPTGSCLIYGGRQLGKSALLRHVQREYHNPEQERYAHVEDIKLFSNSRIGMPTETIWVKIWEAFQKFKLIDSQRAVPVDAEQIIQTIKEIMHKKANVKVLLLFDEADAFLDAEKHNGYVVCDQLRILMQELEHRIKIVFAGLHSVQRFWGDRNQPLAHYGAALCVGPLEADAAQSLIREPFATLGYRFRDNSVVLNILSYTNYHPGLIQLFCQQLLQRMNAGRSGRDEPPYMIDRADVESVYRMQDLRDRFRERFDWTLALDKRYQAIAWTLILDQSGDSDSFSRTYSIAQVLQLVREIWSAGVEKLDYLQFGSLMNEMCGLGVLLRTKDGYYRLRSPNVVRMIGNPDDIQLRLMQLSNESVCEEDIDSYHAPLDCSGKKYSPLSDSQERAVSLGQSSVSLIFASDALGLRMVPDALKRFVPTLMLQDRQAEVKQLPDTVFGAKLAKWIDDYLKRHGKCQRLVIFKQFDDANNASDLLKAACSYVRIRRKQSIRIFFLFNPQAAWSWMQQTQEHIRELENLVDSVVVLHKWSKPAILHRLSQQDKLATIEVCQRIYEATQGWPVLVDKLFQLGKNHGDLRVVADQFLAAEVEMAEFMDTLGLEVIPLAREFIRFFSENRVPAAWLNEEIFPEIVGLSALTLEESIRIVEALKRLNIVEETSEGYFLVDPLVGRNFQQ